MQLAGYNCQSDSIVCGLMQFGDLMVLCSQYMGNSDNVYGLMVELRRILLEFIDALKIILQSLYFYFTYDKYIKIG